MTIALYGSFKSRTRRSIWAILETGAPFDHLPHGAKDPVLRSPDYLAINPTGRIPAFRDEKVTLSESLSINLYLAKTYGKDIEPPLYPVDSEPALLQWSFFAASDLDPWITLYIGHTVALPEDQRHPDLARLALDRLTRSLSFVEAALVRQAFLVGDHFTIADLNVAAVLQPLALNGFDFADYPAVGSWLETQLDRPAAGAAREYP